MLKMARQAGKPALISISLSTTFTTVFPHLFGIDLITNTFLANTKSFYSDSQPDCTVLVALKFNDLKNEIY